MTDNMKKFLEAASKDEALKAELKALADGKPEDAEAVKAATIEFAAKHGFTLTDDDFKPSEITELTEDEMKAVAGGAGCGCGVFGGGGNEGDDDIDCFCFIGGDGVQHRGRPDSKTVCVCAVAGVGVN